MFFNFGIDQIRDFINKERVYMLMLSFIFLFNALIIFGEKIPELKDSRLVEKLLGSGITEEESEAKFDLTADEQTSKNGIAENKDHSLTLLNIFGFLGICVFSLGLFLDIRILMAKIRKKKILVVSTRHTRPKWGVWDIFRIVIIFMFSLFILNIIERVFFSSIIEGKGVLRFFPMLKTGIMDLAILGLIIYFVKVKYRQRLAAIGLKIKDARKLIFLGGLAYLAFLPILAFILLTVIIVAILFNYYPPEQTLIKLFLQEKSIWFLIYSIIMVVIIGPIFEEVFFRGFSYNAIKRKWGAQTAMVLTALVFASLHGNLIGFFPIMALGLLLAYMYEKTGSLVSPITIHILHNAMMIALLFFGRNFMHLVE